jgi:hypothetical protein
VGTVTRAHSLAGSRTTEENEPRHSDEGSLAGSGTTRVWSSGEARSADCVDELSSVLLGAVTLWGADVTSSQARLLHTTITHTPGCRRQAGAGCCNQCTERVGRLDCAARQRQGDRRQRS